MHRHRQRRAAKLERDGPGPHLEPSPAWPFASRTTKPPDIFSTFEVISALLPDLAGKAVIDFGCGEGVLMRRAIELGARQVIGIDIDEQLLAKAPRGILLAGSVERLCEIAHADCIIVANVAAYFTDDQDEVFYREAARILAPSGKPVITHSNELFDLFTFNAYTVAFFRENFGVDVSGLIAHPTLPKRASFNIGENPLAYPDKLARHGFAVERMEFMNRHYLPPLLSRDDPDDMERERPHTLDFADRWKLYFACSMFGVRASMTPESPAHE